MDVITGSISPSGIKISGLISQAVLRGLSAYQVAVANGFEGTQEQWLQSLRGESIQFMSDGLKIYYKYESDTQWSLLVEIDQLLADYSVLDNKPSINNVQLNGNKTLDDLGIQAKGNYVEEVSGYSMVSDDEIERLSHVDNYDDSGVQQAIAAIVAAAVTGVKGVAESEFRRGNVTLTPANLGLGNVDNTHDNAKHVLSAVQDSQGNVIYMTYFSGINESGGEVFLTRPDGTQQKLMNSQHNHDASDITSGTIDIARLPAGALERMVDVENRQARYALTTATVQNGDTVRQLDTGVMYRVVDDTQLNKADGYKEYTAGRASAVPWSGVTEKPASYPPSSHTHEISQITDIANASVAQAAKLTTPRSIALSGGATATGVQFDGTSDITLVVSSIDAAYLAGTGSIDITGNAATATRLASERTISVTGKATAEPKVFDGRYNITLEITDLDAADKVHTHKMSDISDLNLGNFDAATAGAISNFATSNTDAYSDIWFSDPVNVNKPVHNSGVQYNPYRDTLKAGHFYGDLTGNADTASALAVNGGSATHPVYFANGVPVATTYELNATVPADAVFTDTHHQANLVVAGNFNGKVDSSTALTNGNVYINIVENNTVRSAHKITGTGTATVISDEYGNIIINASSDSYSEGLGISISNHVITNSGVRNIVESSVNGNITANINGTATNIPVHGLGTAAYTDSSSYATSNHKHSFSEIQDKPTTLAGYGITDGLSDNHVHDASEITTGTIDIARLPAGAIERLVPVANQAARFALTSAQVQNGDTVQQEDTGVMYRVIDDTNLDNAAGYKEYVAGTASSAPWSGITGKPESFTPSSHDHTISDITDIASAIVAKADQLTNARTIALTGAVTGSGSFDGSANLTIETSASHTHYYASSQTIGGAADQAVRLTVSAGSTAYPVYFYDGQPVALAYQLNATVPADAVFTDTHHVSTTVINSADDSTTNANRAISNGNVFINHVENGVVRASHRVEGTGSVTVTLNSQGDLIINGEGQEYTALPNPYALSINGYTYDGSEAINVGIIDVAHGGTGASSVDSAPTSESTRMVTSGGVYTALAGKADSNHTHLYAGSSTAGGSATAAEKLNTDAGSATQPIYFSNGKPVATTYALNASVPADAVFTDTHHQSATIVGAAATDTTDANISVTNGSVYLNHIENGVVRSSHIISGTGSVTVTTDTSGNIVISGTDTKYTTLPNPYSLSINGKTYDGSEAVTVGVLGVQYGGTGNSSVDTAPTEDSTKMVTSGGVYTALAGKSDTGHSHLYAGSSTAGGSATSAAKLDSNAGSSVQPIYFSGGKPVATTYELNATVPANAVFTDTHHQAKAVVAGANDAIVDTSSALTNTHVFLNIVENGAVRSSHRISGADAVTVTTDSSGNIVITATDTKYTALPNPYSLSINGQTYDGTEAVTVGVLGVAYGGTGNSSADTEPVENSTKFLPSGAIYTALAGKADASHTHLYAGSSSAGGSATSAVKLDSNAGSGTQPVYFSGGKPVATTYELNATVPANAVFTDTHYASSTVVAGANDAIANTSSSLTNTHVFLNHVENGVVVSSHRISGTGSASVTTDASGNIVINAEDTKYTNLPNPYAITIQANGNSLGTYDGSEAKSFNITYSNVGAAAASHGHAWSDISSTPTTLAGYGITDQLAAKTHIHDASEIQSGVLDIARIPVAALERLIVVADETEMFALTTNDVQVGDTVQREDTGVMYRVVDDTNLDNANGYKSYTAGAASSVPWTGITGKPSEYTPAAHSHLYAGSATAGGSATQAEKLNSSTDAGSATNPVFFSGGKPAACTYELNATVPADAVFTDTHHQAKNVVAGTASGSTDTSTGLSNGNVYLNLIENSTVRSSHKISGGGDVTVTTDSSGNIIITASDTKYTHPTYTDHTSGMYKITVDATGHVSAATAIVKADITGLGISASDHDHTLSLATDSGTNEVTLTASTKYKLTAGGQTLVFTTAPDTKYTHPTHTAYESGMYKVTVDASGHVTAATAIAKADITGLGISASDHTHTLTLAKDTTATSTLTLEASQIYKLTAGGNTIVFTTAPDTKYQQGTGITISGTTITNSGVRSVATGSTNGTISVNTDGTSAEVSVAGLGSAAYTDSSDYAGSGHTHTATIAASSGSSALDMEANKVYVLTAGGSSFIFRTPIDTKYTSKEAQASGTDLSLVTTGEKAIWNAKSELTIGNTSTTAAAGNHTHTTSLALDTGTSTVSLAFSGKYKLTAGGTTVIFTMPASPEAISGNAQSATKLETGRSIKVDLTSIYNVSGNAPTFDGSAAFTAPITGTLGVAHGGTGKDTLTTNGILYGNGTSAIGATSAGSAGQVLTSNGSSAPGWTSQSSITAGKATVLATGREIKVDLESIYHSTDNHPTFDGSGNFAVPITGTLPVGHGGTGATTFTANGVLYGSGTNAVGATGAGTSGYLLQANGANAAPSWKDPSTLTVSAATKLSTSRTITLAVASGANGGVTGSASTTFDGNVTINTTLASHTHAASDITSGILDVARGGTGYGVIDDTPTSGSNYVIRSGGVHKRIAYKKILLDKTAWVQAYDQFNTQNEVVYRQAIGTGNDITANTEIVSVQLVGSSVDTNTTENYSETFTGDGSTKKFTLARTPTNIVSVTRGGIGTDAYTVSGKEVTLTEAPNTGISVVIYYDIIYRNDREFAKIRTAETYASVIDFVAKSAPSVDLTIVVGYVSETLDTLSTQATLPTNNRYTSEEYNVSV